MKLICFLLFLLRDFCNVGSFFPPSNPCSPHRTHYTHKVNRMPHNLCLIWSASGTWRRKGERANRRSRLGGLGGFLSSLFHCRCRRWGGYRTFGLDRQKKKIFFIMVHVQISACADEFAETCVCVGVCVCVPVEQEGCPSGVWGSVKLHHEGFASF